MSVVREQPDRAVAVPPSKRRSLVFALPVGELDPSGRRRFHREGVAGSASDANAYGNASPMRSDHWLHAFVDQSGQPGEPRPSLMGLARREQTVSKTGRDRPRVVR